MVFCSICGHSPKEDTQNIIIQCCRCKAKAHRACYELLTDEKKVPSVKTSQWQCSCCTTKIKDNELKKNADVLNKSLEKDYSCLFCNSIAVRKSNQIFHMSKSRSGLWAHSICLRLANEDVCDAPQDWMSRSRADAGALRGTVYEKWDVGMVVVVREGAEHFVGCHAIICSHPTSGFQIQLRLKGVTNSTSNSRNYLNTFMADCRQLNLASPKKRDFVRIISGQLEGHTGIVKEVLGEEVLLYNLPDIFINVSNVAWLLSETNAGENTVEDVGTLPLEPVDLKLKCPKCTATFNGDTMIRCAGENCDQIFHATCGLYICTNSTIQLVTPIPYSNSFSKSGTSRIDSGNVKLLLFCEKHKEELSIKNNKKSAADLIYDLWSIHGSKEDTKSHIEEQVCDINEEDHEPKFFIDRNKDNDDICNPNTLISEETIRINELAVTEKFIAGPFPITEAAKLPPPAASMLQTIPDDPDDRERSLSVKWSMAEKNSELTAIDLQELFSAYGKVVVKPFKGETRCTLNFANAESSSKAMIDLHEKVKSTQSGKEFRLVSICHSKATLFIKGIVKNVKEKDLRKVFKYFGKLIGLIKVDNDNCTAVVKYQQIKSCKNAIKAFHEKEVPGISRPEGVLQVEFEDKKNFTSKSAASLTDLSSRSSTNDVSSKEKEKRSLDKDLTPLGRRSKSQRTDISVVTISAATTHHYPGNLPSRNEGQQTSGSENIQSNLAESFKNPPPPPPIPPLPPPIQNQTVPLNMIALQESAKTSPRRSRFDIPPASDSMLITSTENNSFVASSSVISSLPVAFPSFSLNSIPPSQKALHESSGRVIGNSSSVQINPPLLAVAKGIINIPNLESSQVSSSTSGLFNSTHTTLRLQQNSSVATISAATTHHNPGNLPSRNGGQQTSGSENVQPNLAESFKNPPSPPTSMVVPTTASLSSIPVTTMMRNTSANIRPSWPSQRPASNSSSTQVNISVTLPFSAQRNDDETENMKDNKRRDPRRNK